jgi:hypothetical protein
MSLALNANVFGAERSPKCLRVRQREENMHHSVIGDLQASIVAHSGLNVYQVNIVSDQMLNRPE